MKKLLLSILFLPLFLMACTGDYQAPASNDSVASTTKVATVTKTVKAPLKKVSTSKTKTVVPKLKAAEPVSAVSQNSVVSNIPEIAPAVVATEAPVAPKIETPSPVVTPALSNDNHYTNTAGNEVHSPAYSSSVPAGASAICGDGTYSFSQSRRGTCSHHGGVSEWLN